MPFAQRIVWNVSNGARKNSKSKGPRYQTFLCKSDKKGSSPVCKAAKFGWGCHPCLLLFQANNKVVSYFVGFAQYPTS